ncbi:L-threonylcarbamoyladenylate synthase [Marinicellulosiphila megalodicopiae]|uniref:L-threonylcarbamoyladenylate synthase n=1 Tax=Marinicellulosiphila megalodicopiae TaxID=2724896 RepID=UPI003BB0CB71
MSKIITIHPDSPQLRLIRLVVDALKKGEVVAYPTDSSYALACHMGDKKALDRIRQIRQIDEKHHLTLVCKDLSEISNYARVGNDHYRLMKSNTPGAYTFILEASKEVPKRLMHPKRKTIGLRIPDHAITQAILEELGEPFMSTSLILPGKTQALVEPWDINEQIGHSVDLIVDGGYCADEDTTVVSFLDEVPQIVRQGRGSASILG